MSALICFDFDLTLVHHHLFQETSRLISLGIKREQAIDQIANRIPKEIVSPTSFWPVVKALFEAGHRMSITSFTAYPELCRVLLNEGIRPLRTLSIDSHSLQQFNRTPVIFGGPAPSLAPNTSPRLCISVQSKMWHQGFGKALHIDAAIQYYQSMNHSFDDIYLLDDNPINVALAAQNGIKTIQVDLAHSATAHLSKLAKQLELRWPH